jgi:hypothetical protein
VSDFCRSAAGLVADLWVLYERPLRLGWKNRGDLRCANDENYSSNAPESQES